LKTTEKIAGSFRDPSGFLFKRDDVIYRQVNTIGREDYDFLLKSGLYDALLADGLMIPHTEVDVGPAVPELSYRILRPELIEFISYPYEWCFSQLKDAALCTLRIQKRAFESGMSLKDCSAYNIQFRRCRPVLIDTLSFEKYVEGSPWVAYRQFCQHFLAPLALMAYRDVRLGQLSRVYIDGVPLDLASRLLPFRTRLKFSILTHIHLHAKSQKHYAGKAIDKSSRKMGRLGFLGLVDNLEHAVARLQWKASGTEWGDYYGETNYSTSAMESKKELVSRFVDEAKPKVVWDLGANTGFFSRICAEKGIRTVSFDIDPACVEMNYRDCVSEGETEILPLLLDLTNPSPAIGWGNEERTGIFERGRADTVLALALVHHLAIANNVPIDRIAGFFGDICSALIIEFVPKSDSQAQRMLSTREDIFSGYSREAFEHEFGKRFRILQAQKITDSERTVYLMERRG